jgi:SAM-dependent methyltransferase
MATDSDVSNRFCAVSRAIGRGGPFGRLRAGLDLAIVDFEALMQFTIRSSNLVEQRDGIDAALQCVREWIALGRRDVKIINEYGEHVRPAVLRLSSTSELDDRRQARADRRLAASPLLAAPLRRLGYNSQSLWAKDNCSAILLGFVELCHAEGRSDGSRVRVLEIGGGRWPSFTPVETESARIAYTVNDINAGELAAAPAEFQKARFDIAGDVDPSFCGRFDFVFSRMVLEHVPDARRAWSNMFDLLAPGGVAFAFHPTLYTPAFVINWLAPEALTGPVLRFFFPGRRNIGTRKFPARYDLCFAVQTTVEPILRRLGFRQVLVAPFWGDPYFEQLPGAREANDALSAYAELRDWRWLSSYAYTTALK